MAEEKKPDPAAPPTGDVPTAAKDSGQTQPANAAAAAAAKATNDGDATTAAEQSGDKKAIKAEQPKAGIYVLKEGNKHSAIVEGQRKDLVAGDELELTADQAASFGDKFELKGAGKE